MTDENDARDNETEQCDNRGCSEQYAVTDAVTIKWESASFCSHQCRIEYKEQYNSPERWD